MNGPSGAFRLTEHDERHLGGIFSAGRVAYAQELPVSIQAYLAWSFHDTWHRPVVWVVDTARALDLLAQDLAALGGQRALTASCFPALELLPGAAPRSGQRMDVLGDRLATLQQCARGPVVIATCVQALVQPAPSPGWLERHSIRLELARESDPDALLQLLSESGYRFEAEVQEKGQASHRGGLIDVWPPTHRWPLRLEFFGSVLDSIRIFDPAEQRSLERLDHAVLAPAGENADGDAARLLDHLPPNTLFAWSEPDSLAQHLEMYRATLPEKSPARDDARLEQLRLLVARKFSGGQFVCGFDPSASEPAMELDLHPIEGVPAVTGGALHPDLMEEARRRFVLELRRRAEAGQRLKFFFNTGGSRDRFLETHGTDLAGLPPVEHAVSPLTEGFTSDPLGFTFIAESDLYGFRKLLPGRYDLHAAGRAAGTTRAAREAGRRLADWTDIQPGELVVHMDHGIGKYLGLYDIDFQGRRQEVLAIEYADKARLYVPVSQAHLLSRYVGIGRRRPDLHALGGKRWTREKLSAERAVRDLASALIETQARRDALDGHAFARDTAWQHEFEAAFPFQETQDQHQAIEEVKRDMESRRPMDRLICGDVGYGKTEVAMRAAFKAVMDGKQVAVLTPTTVLALQHTETFRERMKRFPVTIEMLSRLRTPHEQKLVLDGLKGGKIDIVIGTHKLLSGLVKFANLGLLVIDEEHRFGVAHKERIKQMSSNIDVLTMTATPIPRTLNMAFSQLRDLSIIQTAPVDRLAIRTYISPFSEETIREAIMAELSRGGQVYFIHNRVKSIKAVAELIKRLVPAARVAVAHGQMAEGHLEKVMIEFVRRETNVLVSTAIIESGIDIPNVNTIIINRADTFGLAQLYQLRGRVGRSGERAYAWLLVPSRHQMTKDAEQRLSVLMRFTDLGAGFRIASHDLEIRGAGNLLGQEQSGHIDTVGVELFMQLVDEAVRELKGDEVPSEFEPEINLPWAAFIPEDYISEMSQRLGFYKRFSRARDEAELDGLLIEMNDRFGRPPAEINNLKTAIELKILMRRICARRFDLGRDSLSISLGDQCRLDPQYLVLLVQQSAGLFKLTPELKLFRRFLPDEKKDPVGLAKKILLELAEYGT